MSKHRLARTLVALSAALALLVSGIAAVSAAAPQSHLAPMTRDAAVIRAKKVVLPETSIAGPGLFSIVGSFEGVPFNRTVITWTGTDVAHHVNVMTSKDGFSYSNKRILPETSPFRPAVVALSDPAGGIVSVAWTGTDAAHHLNVMWDVYGTRRKVTLADTSIAGPALRFFNGNLYLSWTGTDANHSLNVMSLSLGSLKILFKTVLPQFSSNAGPNLADGHNNSGVVLLWTTRSNHLNLGTSTDGRHFANPLGSGLVQLSTDAPDYLFFHSEGGPEDWLVWTGTDSAHHLNMQWTTHFPQWPDPARTKTVLVDLGAAGPQIEFAPGRLVAWTGTDAAHHLNVAQFENF